MNFQATIIITKNVKISSGWYTKKFSYIFCYNTIDTMMLFNRQKIKTENLALRFVSALVLFIGLILIAEVLFQGIPQLRDLAENIMPVEFILTVPLAAGLLFVYLGMLLRRRKRTAWYLAVILFGIYLLTSIFTLNFVDIFISSTGLIALIVYRSEFIVKSGISNYYVALRNTVFVVTIMLAYGVVGFLLLDGYAFKVEMTPLQALQSTVDTFGIFTEQVVPQTLSGEFFLDSLYITAFMTVAYVLVTFFGPIKQSIIDQTTNKQKMLELIQKYSRDSEDFFKIWPSDKHYYINNDAALAYRVVGGVALVVGDPVGDETDIPELLHSFIDECHINDWTVSFMHIDNRYSHLLRDLGLDIQKLGEEAIINVDEFCENTSRNKHFRNVNNRFIKAGYTTEYLQPPYSASFITALKRVSDSWLTLPGKLERGFMLGYYENEYLQECPVLVVKDDAGQIIAFINQVPSYKVKEANIDLMRHMADAPPNVNDYMFLNYIKLSRDLGFARVNLGLCPLVGIDDIDESATAITNLLKFVYANGSRFFGFEGLARFKNKFEPEWRNRYVAYQDGIVGFTRAMNALSRAMRIKK